MTARAKAIMKAMNRGQGARRLPPPDTSPKITEDDPRWNPKTMGNKTGGAIAFKNGRPTSRPPQKFRGTDGKIHTAPAGSGPLNPIRVKTPPRFKHGRTGPYGGDNRPRPV